MSPGDSGRPVVAITGASASHRFTCRAMHPHRGARLVDPRFLAVIASASIAAIESRPKLDAAQLGRRDAACGNSALGQAHAIESDHIDHGVDALSRPAGKTETGVD
jgi:hypothetical protein